MCIIVVKEVGNHFDAAELRDSFETAKHHNCHGGGFSIKKDGSNDIILSKGYLGYPESMIDAIEAYDIQDNDEVLIHLRRSTAGLINDKNCHPYLISDDIEIIEQVEVVTADYPAVAHNGTFYQYNYAQSPYSDTVNYIKDFLSEDGVLDAIEVITKADFIAGDDMIGNNRLAIMYPDDAKPMLLMGDWNTRYKGTFSYSNYYHTNRYQGYTKPSYNNVGSQYARHAYGY